MPAKVDNNNAEVNPPVLLAIESSCDDTSAAVLLGKTVLSNVVANQEIHHQYGGVVPELASREHQKNIVPVVEAALKKAGISKTDLNAIAFTEGPGLMGSLLVGGSFAKTFSLSLGIPLIAVDHMQGHILAHFIADKTKTEPNFPFLNLTVSGGHTQIVLIESPLKMKVIGKTIDDAAGEAFDKAAKILNLGYPGGPVIDKLAKTGNANKFGYATPQIDGLDYSFSGIKTSFLYHLQREMKLNPEFIKEKLNDICASYQSHVVSYLLSKMAVAINQFGVKDIALAGGVSANSELRRRFLSLAQEKGVNGHIPKFEYCTDNAAMIGIVGYYKYLESKFASYSTTPKARLHF
ncbi:tRNA (adenosine(37)-N6)-threonylcarbamoyltransferase complex transferase subunit TsaD [Flavobacteriales bacterium]|nr:tRNA (adenosine(37)-N6)-threonylcarbamoyltransferase complex transferase subunit TsaD [Flavobacteriales bacterium]MDB4655416.1 tRNA (adenosine(37)-N6)-threonylcarbamoyltransferase complex transferase subunit TsaD [Flavobacteriales bacterium]